VAEFIEEYMVKELMKLESYKKKDYPKALKELFFNLDDMLETPEGKEKLKTYSANKGNRMN
jgi:hypothetical protein